ncbi:SSU ribosomal protein S30E [Enterocytozoon bieneusi H348]|nr:SSU ribosomal protein S30E [Enterocytozoon bieneusi H348]|eukprot:XP_002651637.1 SSU ribosomal protein S30E [Enterocytozoon bieneusi H348]
MVGNTNLFVMVSGRKGSLTFLKLSRSLLYMCLPGKCTSASHFRSKAIVLEKLLCHLLNKEVLKIYPMAGVSINRAGKVRGQTPHVAKKEKPRRKTGAAAKRIKFNKRLELGWFNEKGRVRLNNNLSVKKA